MILILVGLCLIQLCSTKTVQNVSFDLSLIFNDNQLCIDFFGTTNDTKYTLESMDAIFMLEWNPYSNIIVEPETSLNDGSLSVNCSSHNPVTTRTHFVTDIIYNETYVPNGYFVTTSISLKQYFNDDPSMVYSNQKIVISDQPSTTDRTIQYNTIHINTFYTYLFWGLFAMSIFIVSCILLCLRRQYQNAFVVDKALVMIIGIAQYDNSTKPVLPGVRRNVKDLVHLWRERYKYDVFVCNPETLYATKKEVIRFIDSYKNRLSQYDYKAIIFHAICEGTGNNDTIVTSDMKNIQWDFFQHEFISMVEFEGKDLIKLLFHHACRGEATYHTSIPLGHNDIDPNYKNNTLNRGINLFSNNKPPQKSSPYTNCINVFGNVAGRAMSDSGCFTDSVCDSFLKNIRKTFKEDLRTIISEIGATLENKTNGAEIVTTSGMGTIRHRQIRFVASNKSFTIQSPTEEMVEHIVIEGSTQAFPMEEMASVSINDKAKVDCKNEYETDAKAAHHLQYTTMEMQIPNKKIVLSVPDSNSIPVDLFQVSSNQTSLIESDLILVGKNITEDKSKINDADTIMSQQYINPAQQKRREKSKELLLINSLKNLNDEKKEVIDNEQQNKIDKSAHQIDNTTPASCIIEEKSMEFDNFDKNELKINENYIGASADITLDEQIDLDIIQILDEEIGVPNIQSVFDDSITNTTEYHSNKIMTHVGSATNHMENIMYYLGGGGQQNKASNSNESKQNDSQKSNQANNNQQNNNNSNDNNNNSGNMSGAGGGSGSGGDKNRKNENNDSGNNQKDDDDEEEDTNEDEEEKKEDSIEMESSKLNPYAKDFAPGHDHQSTPLTTISEHSTLITDPRTLQSTPIYGTKSHQQKPNTNKHPKYETLSNNSRSISQYELKQPSIAHVSEPMINNGNNKNNTKYKKRNNRNRRPFKERKLKLQFMHIRINSQPYFRKIETADPKLYISDKLVRIIKGKAMTTAIETVGIRNYMNTIFEIHHQQKTEAELQWIGFGFIEKETKQPLYCSINQQQFKNNKGYEYKLNDGLQFLESFEFEPRYKFKRISDEYIKKIKNAMNPEVILRNCNWNQIPIFFRKNDQFRITASITKEQLPKLFKDDANPIRLIPIVSLDRTKVDFAWIIKIHDNIYIALSLEYNEENDNISIHGIHIDKQDLLMRHYLAYPPHMNECNCLHEFESIIHDINIGNTDLWFNKVKQSEATHNNTIIVNNEHESKESILQRTDDSLADIRSNSPTRSTVSSISFSAPTESANNTSLSTSLSQPTIQLKLKMQHGNALQQQTFSNLSLFGSIASSLIPTGYTMNNENIPSYFNNNTDFMSQSEIYGDHK